MVQAWNANIKIGNNTKVPFQNLEKNSKVFDYEKVIVDIINCL